jgi:hypothetical protein
MIENYNRKVSALTDEPLVAILNKYEETKPNKNAMITQESSVKNRIGLDCKLNFQNK